MSKQEIYAVNLMDYGTPSFVSSYITHYGDKESILKILNEENLKRNDLYIAANNFFNKEGDSAASIFGEAKHRIIYNCEVIQERTIEINNLVDEFTNVWGYPYFIEVEKVTCNIIYLKNEDGILLRAIKPQMNNFKFGIEKDRIELLSMHPWGHPGVLTLEQNIIKSNLYILDREFESMEEINDDMSTNELIVDFTGFYSEIFGDG